MCEIQLDRSDNLSDFEILAKSGFVLYAVILIVGFALPIFFDIIGRLFSLVRFSSNYDTDGSGKDGLK